jgi:hypothetical protein
VIRRTCTPPLGAKLAFVAAFGSMSPYLFAQQQPLDREIAFVRALAKDMRFIELARLEADELAKNNTSRGGDQEKIAQLSVEIAYYGARSRSDRVQQRTLFKETVSKSKELIESSTSDSVKQDARTTLANASQDFGQFLVEELDIARETAPESVKDLEAEAAEVFRAGIEACTKVMEVLKAAADKDEAKRTEYFLMWMKKAVLSREQGRSDKANRDVLVNRAISELTELVLEVGEETAIGLRGLFEIAQCKEVLGQIAEAIDTYRSTVTQISTSLEQAQKGELDLSGEMQAFLFEMLQEVYVRTGEVMVREGAEGTAELFAEFRKHLTTFGEKDADLLEVASDPHGHLMLLAESRFLAESGDAKKVADALAMAQKINDKHPADYVGVRAKATLRDILAVQRNLVSGTLLFEIAKGEFQNKNYEEAIKGMRRALPVLTPDEQKKLGLQAYETLGLAFAFSERYLEAILALTEGLRRHGADDSKRASDVADAADRALSAHKRLTKNDPAFADFYRTASEAIAGNSVTAGSKLFWKDANERFNEKKYAEAVALYGKLTPDFTYYEQGLVNVGRAQAAAGDFAAARAALQAFRDYVAKTSLPTSETGKQQVRAQALADAEYTEVGMAYTEARGSEELKKQKDLTKYPAAIEKARGFVTNFAKDGERNIPTVLEYIGRLNSDLGKLDQAEGAYAELKTKDPARASRLATEIFKEYQTQVKALAEEYDQGIAKSAAPATVDKAKADLATARQKLVHLGSDYITNSPKPQLGVLISTMQNWEELGEWKQVDTIAQKTLEQYGSDTNEATKRVIDQIVRPKIGEALLKQRQFQLAYDMLVAAEKANPTQWELKRLICLALGGWFEIDKTGRGKPEPALEKPAEAYTKYFTEYRTWALRPEVKQFSLEWYTFQWELYWFARQAGLKDGKMKEIAEKIYRIARSTDDFGTLKSHGAKGLELLRYFQSNR